ncbi:MAG: hypothetical protein WC852_06935 [Candidatus Nanoarchaeia archaeon]|jgi:hypothetical protein
MKKAALTLLAIAGLCCSGEEPKPKPQAPELVEIAANECKDLCGGKICYEDIWTRVNSGELEGYTIASEGFDNYTNLGGRMIIADKCVFYRLSVDKDSLVLEKLR